MQRSMQHLDDEHMRLYEWSGAGAWITLSGGEPDKPKRPHAWHASYSILALLTALLALNGCDNQSPAEQAGEQVDQALRQMQEEDRRPMMGPGAPGSEPADAAAPAPDTTRGPTGQDIPRP